MLLRSTLLINGICTGLCGLGLVVAPDPLATLLGVPTPTPLAAVGAGVLLYAGGLFWASRRRPIPGPAAWAAIVLDLAWVVGSIALVELGILTSLGAGLVVLVAITVFVFAALQFVGVRRLANAA